MATIEKLANNSGVLFLDCFSGLSGDMIVSGLIDLGVPLSVIEDAVAMLPMGDFAVRHENEIRNTMRVSRFFVEVNEAKQPHRHFSHIREMIEGSSLDANIKKMSIDIFTVLAVAEAAVHGTTIEKVHFHEVGAVDSIVDIVGAAAGFCHLGARVVCAPVPLGTGFVETQHGTLPLPAPATLNVLKGVPVVGTDVESELTTPTGAAIVKAVAERFGTVPSMIPRQIGLGAGSRSLPGRPGILRMVLGEEPKVDTPGYPCTVLEANIDDMTGELAANALDSLMEEGALDVWMEPIQMKKGRPAIKFCVLVPTEKVTAFGYSLMAKTSTIGLRHYGVGRMEMERSMREVKTPFGVVRVKLAKGADGSVNAAPEFEDCKKLAASAGVPLKQVLASAAGLAWELEF